MASRFMFGWSCVVAVVLFACCASAYAEDRVGSHDEISLLESPIYLSDADQTLDIHGYMETQLKSAHITPRGLIIADKGVEIQPVGALVFNLYEGPTLIDKVSTAFGIWNSVNTSLDDPIAGTWFEIDYFARLNLQIADRINLPVQYVAFDSPGGAFSTDNNLEFSLNYDDTDYIAPNVGIHPYARLFYNMSGSSTVIYGRDGNTYDVELGCVPAYVWKFVSDYPVTISVPTYVTVGPKNFWGGNENVGVFTTALAASIPLPFVPSRYGRWHVDASVAYFELLNGKLVDGSALLGCGRDRSRVVGVLGVGFDF